MALDLSKYGVFVDFNDSSWEGWVRLYDQSGRSQEALDGVLKEGLRVLVSDGESLEAEAVVERANGRWMARVDPNTFRNRLTREPVRRKT